MAKEKHTIPACVAEYIRRAGYENPFDEMKDYISLWNDALTANGDFYDYDDTTNGVRRKVHRRSIHPAARIADEWASLVMNERTRVTAKDQRVTDWLEHYFADVSFYVKGQGVVKKAYALGTGAWALWFDLEANKMLPRCYDARQIVPLSWDEDVTECAFVTTVCHKGHEYYQLSMHVSESGTYHIYTRIFDAKSSADVTELFKGVEPDFDTRCPTPTFALVKPGKENIIVDNSPYGESVYSGALDALQAVDLCFDAVFNEVDLGKMRIFISDLLIEYEYTDTDQNGAETKKTVRQALPFGHDNTVFRKVSGTSKDDIIMSVAPELRCDAMKQAYGLALQTMGDLCGFGLEYFRFDENGGLKTATEVSSDNSALMRNIRKHENALADAIVQISYAILTCANEHFGANLPDPGELSVDFDDSIITDTTAEKQQDLAEVAAGTMNTWEYRMKWYGEDESTAKLNNPSFAELQELP